MTTAQYKIKSIAAKIALGGLLIVGLGLGYLYLTPKSYQATARLKVEKTVTGKEAKSTQPENPTDPRLAAEECLVLRSNAFFDRVVEKLSLAQSWAGQNHQTSPLSADAARHVLGSKTDIHPVPNSSLIDIQVTSDNADETAKIANTFAKLYVDDRQSQRQNIIHQKVDLLEKEWDAQNKKIQAAQDQLAQIVFRIERERATNVVYDSDSYDLLQAKRIQLESQFVALSNGLARLKALPPDQLREVLSTLDSETNSLLNPLLLKLGKARREFNVIQSDHGPETSEYKEAKLLVETFDKKVTETINAMMKAKENDLASRKAALDQFAEKLKHAKRADGQLDTNMVQDAAYNQAFQNLDHLKKERDALQDQLNESSLKEAIHPLVVTAQLVDQADVPTAPFTPNTRFAKKIIGTGAILVLGGIGLFFLSLNLKPRKR